MNNLIFTQLKSQLNLKKLALQIIALILISLALINSPDLINAFSERQKLRIGIANEDTNPLIGVLINSFESNEAFNAQFKISIKEKAEIIQDFKNAELDCYLVIPDGFTESIMGYQQRSLKIYSKDGFPTQRNLLKNIFESYSQYIKFTNGATITLYQHLKAEGASPKLLNDSNNQFSVEMIQVAMGRQSHFELKAIDEMANSSSQDYYIISLSILLISLAMIISSAKALQFIDSKIGARVAITNISNLQYLISLHIVNLLSVALFIIFFLGLSVVFDLEISRLLISLILASFFSSSLFLTLALYSKDMTSLIAIASALAIAFAVLGGALTPLAILPNNLKQIAIFTPQFAFSGFCLNLPSFNYWLLAFYVLLAIILLPIQARQLRKRIRS